MSTSPGATRYTIASMLIAEGWYQTNGRRRRLARFPLSGGTGIELLDRFEEHRLREREAGERYLRKYAPTIDRRTISGRIWAIYRALGGRTYAEGFKLPNYDKALTLAYGNDHSDVLEAMLLGKDIQ